MNEQSTNFSRQCLNVTSKHDLYDPNRNDGEKKAYLFSSQQNSARNETQPKHGWTKTRPEKHGWNNKITSPDSRTNWQRSQHSDSSWSTKPTKETHGRLSTNRLNAHAEEQRRHGHPAASHTQSSRRNTQQKKKEPKDSLFLLRNWPWVHMTAPPPADANLVGFERRIGGSGFWKGGVGEERTKREGIECGKKRMDPGSEEGEIRGAFPLNSGPWRAGGPPCPDALDGGCW
jgi:hypothetical protein